jgi:hypothetical protein
MNPLGGEEDEPVGFYRRLRRMNPLGFIGASTPPLPSLRDGSGGVEAPINAGVATTASLNGLRRTEKATVLEKA